MLRDIFIHIEIRCPLGGWRGPMKLRLHSAFAVTLLFCLLSSTVFGAVTGRISGTVKDPTGAVVPGAEITAHETQTGIRTVTKADAAGFYSFPQLPVGRYDLYVKATGFK